MKQLLYIDLFCGAGGTSTGVNSARLHDEQCAEVIACVNHDAKAIASLPADKPVHHMPQIIRTHCISLKIYARWNYLLSMRTLQSAEKKTQMH